MPEMLVYNLTQPDFAPGFLSNEWIAPAAMSSGRSDPGRERHVRVEGEPRRPLFAGWAAAVDRYLATANLAPGDYTLFVTVCGGHERRMGRLVNVTVPEPKPPLTLSSPGALR